MTASRLSLVRAIEREHKLLEDLPRRKRLRNPNRKRSVRRWLQRTAKHRDLAVPAPYSGPTVALQELRP